MKRKGTIFLIFVVVLFQFISPIKSVIAQENIDDFFQVDELKEQDRFYVTWNKAESYENIEVLLPKESTYDKKVLERYIGKENNSQIIHDKKENKLIVSNKIKINELDLKILNVKNGNNSLVLKSTNSEGKVLSELKHQFIKEETNEEDISNKNLQRNKELRIEKNSIISEVGLRRDLSITSINNPVLTGKDAVYEIELKVTGSQVEYANISMNIKLPDNDNVRFSQKLEELSIANVIPVFDEKSNNLTYNFDRLKSGQTYKVLLKIGTTNGVMLNDEKLEVIGNLESADFPELNQESKAESVTRATNGMVITKNFIGSVKNGITTPPTTGANLLWEIKVSIPNKNEGQLYLEPGSKIQVKDKLSEHLSYLNGAEENLIKYEPSDKELLWEFIAPSIEEQKKSKDNLFEKTFRYWTLVADDDSIINKEVDNHASFHASFIDGEYRNPGAEASAKSKIYKYREELEGANGSIVVPKHWPAEKGEYYDSDRFDISESIYLMSYAKEHDLEALTISYTIDDNLFLEELQLSDKEWTVGTTSEQASVYLPTNPQPDFDIYIDYYDTKNKLIKDYIIESPEKGKSYTLNELGLESGDRVKEIRYVFKGVIPKNLSSPNGFKYTFSVKKGYEGLVTNSTNMSGRSTYNTKEGTFSDGTKFFDFDFMKDSPGLMGKNKSFGPRSVLIVPRPGGEVPIAEISVQLQKEDFGVIEVGQNVMEVIYNNTKESTMPIEKDLEATVLLPPGIKISNSPNLQLYNDASLLTKGSYAIISDNYKNSGRQLVKINWDDNYIRINSFNKALINVDVLETAPTILNFDVYGFSGNETLNVPDYENPTYISTILQKDIDDLNQDGKTDTPRIKSQNLYTVVNRFDLQTEKFVRSSSSQWSKFDKVKPGGDIDYKLTMTNTTDKDISIMTLIDVLPSVGDIGITDNISRGSQFTPKLKGPIVLPKEWVGKVDVYYSNQKNPMRDDLIRYTKYPNLTQQLGNPDEATEPNWKKEQEVNDWKNIHSFKIELNPFSTWIKGTDISITFQMTAPTIDEIDDEKILDESIPSIERAAWNSFAVSTDFSQPVEPYQVGVYLEGYKGKLSIKKIDKESKKALKDAEFEIKNSDGSSVYSVKTDSEGFAQLEDLPFGKYSIFEVKAPDGYNLLKNPIDFEITAKNNNIDLIIGNTKKAPPLPSTGGIGTLIFYAIGGIIMLGGGWMLLTSKRRESK